MAVALEDLGRARRGLESEALAGGSLDLGIGRRVRADGAGELADTHPFEGVLDPDEIMVRLMQQHETQAVALQAARQEHVQSAQTRSLRDEQDAAYAARCPFLLPRLCFV